MPSFSGADADAIGHVEDEDFAVSDTACFGGARDGLDDALDLIIGHRHLDFDLRDELDRILLSAVGFLVTFLAAKAFDLGHGHALHTDFQQRILDFIQFERLDDRFD